ncbi:MAG: hypothetical protein AB7O96_13255 [Pseudobdellovibrionaceae bacterium]
MRTLLFSAILILSGTAYGNHYHCVTSPDAPTKFYEYEDTVGYRDVNLYEMKNGSDALKFVDRHPKELNFKDTDVTLLKEYRGLTASVIEGDRVLLQAPEPMSVSGFAAEVKATDSIELVFDGKKVKSVIFIYCGKD